jgi:hypothetical protein
LGTTDDAKEHKTTPSIGGRWHSQDTYHHLVAKAAYLQVSDQQQEPAHNAKHCRSNRNKIINYKNRNNNNDNNRNNRNNHNTTLSISATHMSPMASASPPLARLLNNRIA